MRPNELLPWRAMSIDAPCPPEQVVDRLLEDDPVVRPFIGEASGDDFAVRLRAARFGREPLVAAYGHMQARSRGTRVDVMVKPHGMAYVGMLLHALLIAGVLVAPAIVYHVAEDPQPSVIVRAIALFFGCFVLIEALLIRFDAGECARAVRARLCRRAPVDAGYRDAR